MLQGDAITTAVFIVQLGHKHHLIQGRPGLSGVCGFLGHFYSYLEVISNILSKFMFRYH